MSFDHYRDSLIEEMNAPKIRLKIQSLTLSSGKFRVHLNYRGRPIPHINMYYRKRGIMISLFNSALKISQLNFISCLIVLGAIVSPRRRNRFSPGD